MVSVNFYCPNCGTYLNYRGILPSRTNCPVCQSGVDLDSSGQPHLVRIGPPAPRRGARTIGGAALGAILGTALGGPGGAIVGAIIGGVVGGLNEPRE